MDCAMRSQHAPYIRVQSFSTNNGWLVFDGICVCSLANASFQLFNSFNWPKQDNAIISMEKKKERKKKQRTKIQICELLNELKIEIKNKNEEMFEYETDR